MLKYRNETTIQLEEYFIDNEIQPWTKINFFNLHLILQFSAIGTLHFDEKGNSD